MISVEAVAKLCHQANKAYCEGIGDFSQVDWENTSEEVRQSARDGVEFQLGNPMAMDCSSHNNWVQFKCSHGWKYGPVKDEDKKEHPCLIPFEELPLEQQLKDGIFRRLVNTLRPLIVY